MVVKGVGPASEEMAEDVFQVALVGEFQDKGSPPTGNSCDLAKGGGNVHQMVEHSNHHRRIHCVGRQGKSIDVGGHVDESLVAELLPSVVELGDGVVEEDDLIVSLVGGRQSAESAPQVK
jgi:hypothetical protein